MAIKNVRITFARAETSVDADNYPLWSGQFNLGSLKEGDTITAEFINDDDTVADTQTIFPQPQE